MHIKIYATLSEIAKVKWNGLEHGDFPFSGYDFLHSLEVAGCVGLAAGWVPQYLTLWQSDELVGAMYLYEKSHSYGEYIFDWQWAKTYERYGEPYYPKLLAAVPFTPATGPKILAHAAFDRREIEISLIAAARDLLTSRGCHSLHVLFIPEREIAAYRDAGFMVRHTFQYHWQNNGYKTFDDFLFALKGDKRKKIVKERREVGALGVKLEIVTGEQLRPAHARAMHRFYRSTIDKMQAIPYLNLAFFEQIFAAIPHEIVLCLARREGALSEDEWVAGALNFRRGTSLFGRYWGCAEEFSFLHFELCYYQTVEFAIAQGIELFEAGAQGGHKLQRGFLPNVTYSAHFMCDSRFHNALELYTKEEAKVLEAEMDAAKTHYPFKQVLP